MASDWLGTSLRHVLLVRYFSRSESHHVCVSFCFPVLLFQFLVCHAVSWWSRWLLWDPMAKWYFHVPESKLRKFSKALVSNWFHVLFAFCAWRILTPTTHKWLWSPDQWSQGLEDPTVAPDLKFYYLLYAARYTSELVSLFYEPTRSVSTVVPKVFFLVCCVSFAKLSLF